MDTALFSYFYLHSIQYNTIKLSKKCLYGYYVLFTIINNLKIDEKKKKTEMSVVTTSKFFTVHQTNLYWPLPCYDILETLLKDLQNENSIVITKKKKKYRKKKGQISLFSFLTVSKVRMMLPGKFLTLMRLP